MVWYLFAARIEFMVCRCCSLIMLLQTSISRYTDVLPSRSRAHSQRVPLTNGTIGSNISLETNDAYYTHYSDVVIPDPIYAEPTNSQYYNTNL